MDYIQLMIGGQMRGLKFNTLTYIKYYEGYNEDLYLATFHYDIIYAALLSNAYVKKEEFTASFEQVCDWVDEMPVEDKARVTECFTQSKAFKNLTAGKEEEKPALKKKKLKTTITTA